MRAAQSRHLAECVGCPVCAAGFGEVLAEVTEVKSPEARTRAIRSLVQGAVLAGAVAVYEGAATILGGPHDPKIMAYAAGSAFASGVLSWLHRKADERKAVKQAGEPEPAARELTEFDAT